MSREREDFIARWIHETERTATGIHSRVYDCRLLMRQAATLKRIAESECNDDLPEHLVAKRDRRRDTALVAVQRVLGRYNGPEGKGPFVPVFSNDPRGAVLKIKVPSGYTDDWGQEGVCVPSR